MAPLEKQFPPIRACIFDMDGLLINSEDLITQSINQLLEKYSKPPIPPLIRAQLIGIPNSTNGDVFHNWANLRIPREQCAHESSTEMEMLFPNCVPLPGAEKLLSTLSRARSTSANDPIQLALASSTKSHHYKLKTTKLETRQLLDTFQSNKRILGDDPRVPKGREKPAPDIFLTALQELNVAAHLAGNPISPDECLVFEDSVIGVEAGRRAGMRVVWVPHPDLAIAYKEKHHLVLTGRTGLIRIGDSWQLGQVNDGWAEYISSLEEFDYAKYGIIV